MVYRTTATVDRIESMEVTDARPFRSQCACRIIRLRPSGWRWSRRAAAPRRNTFPVHLFLCILFFFFFFFLMRARCHRNQLQPSEVNQMNCCWMCRRLPSTEDYGPSRFDATIAKPPGERERRYGRRMS